MTSTAAQGSSTYTTVAKTLHWVIALAIIGLIIMGWMFEGMPRDASKFKLIQLHKSVGITVLLLSLLRLAWRFTHKAPAYPATMARWELRVALVTHIAFYTLMIGIPLAGWAMVSASPLNIPTMLYGVIPWPHLPILPELPNKREVGHMFREAHELMANGLAFLLLLHVGAALKHHFVSKDDVLLRMAPRVFSSFLLGLRKLPLLRKLALLILAGTLLSSPAIAKPWSVDNSASHVTFQGSQGGTAFQGGFSRFTVAIDFDTAHPEKGSISANVDTSSATAGAKERDDALPQSDWFNISKFPSATFASHAIRTASTTKPNASCYTAEGTLTIKGISKPVTLPFCLTPEGDHSRAQGSLQIIRSDFHVGDGEWATEDIIKFAVDVSIDLAVKPAP